jgi:cytidylate kinase
MEEEEMGNQNLAITISHQLGSGGASLGQKLSERLGIPFIDRDVLKKVAEQLNLAEAVLDCREERVNTFWQSFAQMASYTDPQGLLTFDHYLPSDRELFELESDYIARIAEKSSAIFLGRCGRYVLRDHPGRVSILVYADLPDRVKRIRDLYKLKEDAAKSLIETNDRERTAYIRAFTRENWLDASLYDVCINTSSLGLEKALEMIVMAIKA